MARYNTITTATTSSGAQTLASPSTGLLTTLTGAAPYTVTVPNPVLYPGATQSFYNATSGIVTLSAPAGVFNGPGSSGTGTQAIQVGTTINIVSDGANYIITSWLNGPAVHTTGTFSGALQGTSSVTFNPANASISLQPTGTGTVTINPATAGSIDAMSIGATTRGSGAFTTLAANSTLTLSSTSASHTISSTATSSGSGSGALVVSGGVGIGGALNTNSSASFNGDVDLSGPAGGANITRYPTAAPYAPLVIRFKNGNGANSAGIKLQTANTAAAYTDRLTINTDTDNPTVTINAGTTGALNVTGAKTTFQSYNGNDVLEVNVTSGNTSPYMRFKTNGSNNGYIQFLSTGGSYIWNDVNNTGLRVTSGSTGASYYDGGTYQTIWHSGISPTTTTSGAGGNASTSGNGANAKYLNGYGIEYFTIMERLYQVSLTSGTTSNYYCMEIQPNQWGSGIAALDIRRTSVHQDGGGYGAFFGRLRYRSTAWGHHSDFWELEENWGNGNYPFFAKAQGNPYASYMYIWLKGGLSYYLNFNGSDYVLQNPVANHLTLSAYDTTFTTLGDKVTSTSVPDQSKYYQMHVASKGYNLGATSYRWNAIYLSTAPDVSSDVRLKENFGDALGLDFLMALKPCTFTMKDYRLVQDDPAIKWDQRRRHGLIAQELQELLEELGLTSNDFAGLNDENPDHLSIIYEQFIPILIKSVQQQQGMIVDLQDRLAAVENK